MCEHISTYRDAATSCAKVVPRPTTRHSNSFNRGPTVECAFTACFSRCILDPPLLRHIDPSIEAFHARNQRLCICNSVRILYDSMQSVRPKTQYPLQSFPPLTSVRETFCNLQLPGLGLCLSEGFFNSEFHFCSCEGTSNYLSLAVPWFNI